MSRLSQLFHSKPSAAPAPQAVQPTALSGIKIQSSVFGKAIPVIYGTTRVTGNLNQYGNFTAVPIYSSPAATGGGGGKGGLFGSGGGGNSAQPTITSYNYYAAFAYTLCEGPIAGIGKVWQDKNITTLSALGFSLFTGTYSQAAWGTSVSWPGGNSNPLNYRGFAYVAASSYSLGTSASMPNHTYEVQGIFYGSVPNSYDADPSLIIPDILTNVHYGIDFPTGYIGDLTNYQNYCFAANLVISSAYDTQRTGNQIVSEICQATNSEAVWSSGKLNIRPYGDQAISGNGKSYVPPQQPIYDLTDDDFMLAQSGSGSSSSTGNGPILIKRKRPSDRVNSVKIEFLDRANDYNNGIAYANDQALIDTYKLHANGSLQLHIFCNAASANASAQLQLRRYQILNHYSFDLDQRYSLLDPMDIVSLTDATLGLNKQWVRILEITENDDGSLNFLAEEYLTGTGAAPAYTYASGIGYNVNTNIAPGVMNTPIFFEPPDALAGALEVWCGASGDPNWGGADVYISTDGNTYQKAGRVSGSSRVGVLSSAIPSVAAAPTGQTIDLTSTPIVNLTQSAGTLLSVSQNLAQSYNTLCYCDGELFSYATANLTGLYTYTLSYLVRGAYSTTIASHAIGKNFLRVDDSIFKIPFTQDRIGQTIYIKFASFNQYGGGQLSLSQVAAFTYTITGSALSSPLPDVTNVVQSFLSNSTVIDWSEIKDFRPTLYEVRKGSSWIGGQFLARQAHPPFRCQGDGTYWISPYSQPASGLVVYGANPQSIVVNGSALTTNLVISHQEDPGWAGTLSGNVAVVGATVQSNGANGGTYTIPVGDRITLQGVASCGVLISWTSTGSPLNNNWLGLADFLGTADLLGGAAAVNVNVYPEIRLSQDGTTWGAWQKYQAGVYTAKAYDAQMQILTIDPNTVAILSAMKFGLDAPNRDDHFNSFAVSIGGSTVTFRPDGGSSTPFNGGPPGGGSLPNVQATIVGGSGGDTAIVSSISLTSCVVTCYNSAGTSVARTVNILARGY